MKTGRSRRVPPSRWLDYRAGELAADGVSLESIAAAHGTPTWVYSARSLDESYAAIDRAFGPQRRLIAYAVKANGALAILARLGRQGGGADIVSGGELARCLRAGIPPERIVFSGAGKRADEIELAVESRIRALHVEVVDEIEILAAIARRRGLRFPIALRINPEVEGGAHKYIATGETDTKFGLDVRTVRRLLPRIAATPEIVLRGLACHVGSQLHRARPVGVAAERLAKLALELRASGFPIEDLDVGGGLPIDYGDTPQTPDAPAQFADAVDSGFRAAGLSRDDVTVLVEPGRAIVGEAGILLTRVLFVKEQPPVAKGTPPRRFVIVDAGMSELIRPALYGARHAVMVVRQRPRF
ncbi:MAG: diaminopimelate decarboxylase, partial [Deltaproteobacteria bacterium]|nr:diaminopimelate decarboxylase [Deltaproteobacteria bacterium]